MAQKKSAKKPQPAKTSKPAAAAEPEPRPARTGTRQLKPKAPGRLRTLLGFGIGFNPKGSDPKTAGQGPMATGPTLLMQSIRVPWRHWEIFGGILLIYTVINLILVGGVGGGAGDLTTLKDSLSDVFTGRFSNISTGFTLFAFLVTSGTGTASGVASAYQTVLLLVTSVGIIWALRKIYGGQHIRIRDVYYSGMTPLIRFVLVLMAVGLTVLPAVFGGFLFSALVGGQVLSEWYEQTLVGLVCFGLMVWSLYLLISWFFALYVVTLPDVGPVAALRTARQIVRGRILLVVRKLLFFVVAVLAGMVVIMVPAVLFVTPFAPFIFFLLTILIILLVHSYLYALYRELIV